MKAIRASLPPADFRPGEKINETRRPTWHACLDTACDCSYAQLAEAADRAADCFGSVPRTLRIGVNPDIESIICSLGALAAGHVVWLLLAGECVQTSSFDGIARARAAPTGPGAARLPSTGSGPSCRYPKELLDTYRGTHAAVHFQSPAIARHGMSGSCAFSSLGSRRLASERISRFLSTSCRVRRSRRNDSKSCPAVSDSMLAIASSRWRR